MQVLTTFLASTKLCSLLPNTSLFLAAQTQILNSSTVTAEVNDEENRFDCYLKWTVFYSYIKSVGRCKSDCWATYKFQVLYCASNIAAMMCMTEIKLNGGKKGFRWTWHGMAWHGIHHKENFYNCLNCKLMTKKSNLQVGSTCLSVFFYLKATRKTHAWLLGYLCDCCAFV